MTSRQAPERVASAAAAAARKQSTEDASAQEVVDDLGAQLRDQEQQTGGR